MAANRSTRSILIHNPLSSALALVLAAVLAPSASIAQEKPDRAGLEATIEVLRPFAYEGEELLVRVTVTNTAEKPFESAGIIDLAGGLKVLAGPDFNPLKNQSKPGNARSKPEVLPGGGFFGAIQDIVSVVPDMKKAGDYRISWEGAGVSSNTVTVMVIPRFDPEEKYVAVFETDYGLMEFDLLTDIAPAHVQNFYDLAGQGFYDNTMLHQVIKGVELRGGDQTGTGDGRPIYLLDPEIGNAKHLRGTLSMVRSQHRLKDNGSQFVITLSPVESYDGVLSVFGQVRSGQDTLTAIENLPTSGQYKAPYFRPLQPVFIKSVSVQRATQRKAAGG